MRTRWCEDCGRKVYPRTLRGWTTSEAFLHSALLALTCGLYLPLWLHFLLRVHYACPRCGSKV